MTIPIMLYSLLTGCHSIESIQNDEPVELPGDDTADTGFVEEECVQESCDTYMYTEYHNWQEGMGYCPDLGPKEGVLNNVIAIEKFESAENENPIGYLLTSDAQIVVQEYINDGSKVVFEELAIVSLPVSQYGSPRSISVRFNPQQNKEYLYYVSSNGGYSIPIMADGSLQTNGGGIEHIYQDSDLRDVAPTTSGYAFATSNDISLTEEFQYPSSGFKIATNYWPDAENYQVERVCFANETGEDLCFEKERGVDAFSMIDLEGHPNQVPSLSVDFVQRNDQPYVEVSFGTILSGLHFLTLDNVTFSEQASALGLSASGFIRDTNWFEFSTEIGQVRFDANQEGYDGLFVKDQYSDLYIDLASPMGLASSEATMELMGVFVPGTVGATVFVL